MQARNEWNSGEMHGCRNVKACDCISKKGDASGLWLQRPTAAASASVSLVDGRASAPACLYDGQSPAHNARQSLMLSYRACHRYRNLHDKDGTSLRI